MRPLQDLQGNEAALGRCLGRGGEGAVYSVPARPQLVAKIYAQKPDDHASRKLAAMVQLGTEALASCAAWPQNLLLDDRTGSVLGFLMPRVDAHREIHTLYGPTNRKTAFPDANWAFLVRAARNVAAAFHTVHQHGHVIGDVNQANVVVSRRATVRLIDCDSFQITHLSRTYPCRVGVPLFTPPELQGQRLEGVVRTPDHDRFGLAVLVFHLLFMGRHPFAGRHPERVLPVEKAIREGLFAFGEGAARQGWEPPPFSLLLPDIPPPLGQLLERAFGPAAAAGGPRPSAGEWVEQLDALDAKMVTCGDDPRHAHVKAAGSCPWCRIEKEGGPSFFFLPPGSAPDAFDLAATWKAIEAVRSPGPCPLPPPPSTTGLVGRPLALEVKVARVFLGLLLLCLMGFSIAYRWFAGWLAVIGLIGLYATRRWNPDWRAERDRRRREVAACEGDLRRLESQWGEMCSESRFARKRDELEKAKLAFEGLGALEQSEWSELAALFCEAGLPSHLKTFPLEFSRIPGLGPDELSILAARGVTTAADVTPAALLAARGIDRQLVKSLLVFKDVAARSFKPDPAIEIPPSDQRALAERHTKRREELLKTLQAGPMDLVELRRGTQVGRDQLGRAHAGLHRKLAQLRADAEMA